MPDAGEVVETRTETVPGSNFFFHQEAAREQRARRSEALADRHTADSIDKQLEADLRVSLNMDNWPVNLIFDIRIEDTNGDYVYAPVYPTYEQDEVFYYEYGDGSSFDGMHTLRKWVSRHQDDLTRLGQMAMAMETGVFR